MILIDLDKLLDALQITSIKESCNGCWHQSRNWLQCVDDIPLSEACKVIHEQPRIIVEMEDDTMKLPNYKLCTLHLHPEKDADIIRWLDAQRLADTKTNAIRKLIRAQIRKEIREKIGGELR